jgi:CheY-like chemotaxis protein
MIVAELQTTYSGAPAVSEFRRWFVTLSRFMLTTRAALLAVRQSLSSEMKNFLIWQDQLADNEEEPPLILIAGDDVFMRSALEFHLTRAGFRVEHASNGNEAVAKTTKQTAVVLLDLVMPGTYGFYCLRDIRKSSPGTKIIAITRKRHAQDPPLCRKLGAYGSLPKPLDPNDVVETVARAVNNEPVCRIAFASSA